MPEPLPRLRTNLDFMPSPDEKRPGLLIRDSYQYSDATLIVPPLLVECLQFFDGEHTELDLRQLLVQLTGDLRTSDIEEHLVRSLSDAGFLDNENYARLREERHREFASAPVREPAHAGSAYPDAPDELSLQLAGYLKDGKGSPADATLVGVAAPHVSLDGGWESYQSAYRLLGPQYADRTFVVLGTSHYGSPERFGLTRKPFVSPLGEAVTDLGLVDRLERHGGPAVLMEDYCHSIEHSIEFQVLFLQHLYGAKVRILPVLCGAFGRSIYEGGMPEDDDDVRQFLGALGDIAASERVRLFWVLGIDMAHMGRRYGDRFAARASQDTMESVAARDRARIRRLSEGDRAGFWTLVQENHDDLKWCGSSVLYTFLAAIPSARARLEHYQQWNIDPQSVVSFGGLGFIAGQ